MNSAVGQLGFYVFWIQSGLVPGHPFQTASTVIPVGSGSSFMVVCQHYPGYRGSQHTTKTRCPGHRCTNEMHTNNLSSFELRYVYYVVQIAICYVQLCYCFSYFSTSHRGLTDGKNIILRFNLNLTIHLKLTTCKTDRVQLMYVSVDGYVFWLPNTLQR